MLPIKGCDEDEDELHDESELRLELLAPECGGRQGEGEGGQDIDSDMSVGIGPNTVD